ncbi:uncharacterized protein LOC131656979 [Vicia villosa]|uniref:uncharacterized protein LOC131656979 n=1 Tax=Vicia villosa TaxID=3911 RepID=UPI00273B3A9A|nr:uncharacterized protein LOC131656979 [Vicia villosa]
MSCSSNIPTNHLSFLFFQSNLKIPSKNYSHTMSIETLEISQDNIEEKGATIELHIQGLYKLYVQPFKALPPLTMENYFIVSPKLSYKLKIPLLFLIEKPTFSPLYVAQKLAKLPISSSLAAYLEPHIVQNAVELGRKCGNKEFKIVFDVKFVEIDLADYSECEGYETCGLV